MSIFFDSFYFVDLLKFSNSGVSFMKNNFILSGMGFFDSFVRYPAAK